MVITGAICVFFLLISGTILVTNSNLYPIEFIQKYGESSTHWGRETWIERELSLRHDMVCSLLCNLTKKRNIKPLGPPSKRRKLDDEETPGTSKDTDPSGSSSDDFKYDIATWSDQPPDADDDMDDDNDLMPRFERETRYRFTMLEGKHNISLIQNTFAGKWKTNLPNRQWDLIDRDDKKFIEVKVTINFIKAESDYLAYSSNNIGHTALYMIHPNSLDSKWIDHQGNVPGEAKVKSFLITRKAAMERLQIGESELLEVKDLTPEIFVCNKLNNMVIDWISPMWKLRNTPVPMNYSSGDHPYEQVTVDGLLNNLEDPRLRHDCDVIQWTGKVLPNLMCEDLKTKSATDIEMIEEFLSQMTECTGDNEPMTLLKSIFTLWENNHNNFKLISKGDLKRSKTHELLMKMLGIGMKSSYRDDSCQETRQPIILDHEKKRYHPWFDNLLEALSRPHHEDITLFQNLIGNETPSDHPMDNITSQVVDAICEEFSKTNLALYCSKVINFYSRLGGSYLGDDKGISNHGNISIFPLYSVGSDSMGNSIRLVNGVCIRAPHHATRSTDRIAIITIEKITTDNDYSRYIQFVKNKRLIQSPNGTYIMRQNAIMKIDPAYLTFIENALFVPCNLSGEILLTGLANEIEGINRNDIGLWVRNHNAWLMERVTESVVNATFGGAQEEELFSVLRKIFMILLAWGRGEMAVCCDLKELCEKMNECLIDHPLAMHYQCSIIDILIIMDSDT